MDILLFVGTLLFTLSVVAIATLYLRRVTRKVIQELCHTDTAAEFWLRSTDIMAYSGALILVLLFGDSDMNNLVETLRITLLLTLCGIFISVMFVAHNIWKTVAPTSSRQGVQA